jgi:GTP pyrophosphokinase
VQERAAEYLPSTALRQIQRAYVFCAKAHEGQSRLSGEPYLVHPLAVAEILAEMHLDAVSVTAGLLHDVLEDTSRGLDEIEALFGEDVAHVVDGVTKLSRLDATTREEAQAESFRKMILAMADDLRVIIVKLADRLHNMRTLAYLPREKRLRIARETREIYAPIAHRLGMGRLKHELDDLAFEHAEPERHAALVGELEQRRPAEEGLLRRTESRLREAMDAAGIRAQVQGRRKSLASIQRKLIARNIGIDQVYDYLAFRILVDDVKDCYAALGVIHSTWTPIQARFKDFIATPKPNGYRSLHTTVVGESGQPFEVQIRTQAMHLVAEDGVAAHWGYKEGQEDLSAREAETFAWLRNLLDAQRDHADPLEFMAAVKLDLYGDEVYCFTPKGEVKVLPAGSTAIDFAYAIHTEVGHHCVGARIDGAMVPLRTRLAHGTRVEILTSPSQRPRRDWLQHVATSRARIKVRQWFNQRERVETTEIGRSLLEREARRHRVTLKRVQKSEELPKALAAWGLRDADDLFLALGQDRLRPGVVLGRLGFTRPAEPARAPDRAAPRGRAAPPDRASPPDRAAPHHARKRGARDPVVVGDLDIATTMARCCHPVRGDAIRGYVTRGRGVAIHRKDCRNIQAAAGVEGRLLDAAWNPDSDARFPTHLRLDVENRPGMLGDVTGALSALETNILEATAKAVSSRKGVISLSVEVEDRDHLERVVRALQDVKGVSHVAR